MRFNKWKTALGSACLSAALVGMPFFGRAAQESEDKLVYADFETAKDNRPVSNRGGAVRLWSYQESSLRPSRFRGVGDSNVPELVRPSKDSPNKAIAFEYELQAPNQYAAVGVGIDAQEWKDGKVPPLDVSRYKYLTLQLYATGAESVRVELISRGHGISTNAYPQASFRVWPGFNIYRIPLNSFAQPSWTDEKVSTKAVLQKLTSINILVACDNCTPAKGMVVVDNVAFQN